MMLICDIQFSISRYSGGQGRIIPEVADAALQVRIHSHAHNILKRWRVSANGFSRDYSWAAIPNTSRAARHTIGAVTV